MNPVALICTDLAITAFNVAMIVPILRDLRRRDAERRQVLAREGLEVRTVWFWQAGSLLERGWTTGWREPTLNPFTWLVYAQERLRPTMTRRISGGSCR